MKVYITQWEYDQFASCSYNQSSFHLGSIFLILESWGPTFYAGYNMRQKWHCASALVLGSRTLVISTSWCLVEFSQLGTWAAGHASWRCGVKSPRDYTERAVSWGSHRILQKQKDLTTHCSNPGPWGRIIKSVRLGWFVTRWTITPIIVTTSIHFPWGKMTQ